MIEDEGFPWYDTEAGITKALEHGLAGLHEIFDGRHINYGKGQRLREWCLLGRFYLDTCGNCSLITEGAPAEASSWSIRKQVRKVMAWQDAIALTERAQSSSAGLPKIMDVCDRCRNGWTIDNCHDVVWTHDWKRPRHRLCNELAMIQESMHEIYEILKAAEIEGPVFFVPNRYWPTHRCYDDVRTPWAIIQTTRGPIRIGWRKHVIEIDWALDGAEFTATGGDVANGDGTTAREKLVHAWGRDKAVEYLRRLWSST